MKLALVIHINKRMFPIKNDIKCKYYLTGSNDFQYIASSRGNILKCILTYLYSTKYKDNNIRHLDAQPHFL